MRTYCVYILANRSRSLYVGISNDLLRRIKEHRAGDHPCYTRDFRIIRLVYFESTTDVAAAIAREKQLKRWPRWRKLRLIELGNAGWRDLSADWFPDDRAHLEYSAPGDP